MLCNDYHANALERLVCGEPVLYPFYQNTNASGLQDALIWGFNYDFDHIQVSRVLDTRDDSKELQFQSAHRMEPRVKHDLRRLLWKELDKDGKEVLLVAIHAFFDFEYLTG